MRGSWVVVALAVLPIACSSDGIPACITVDTSCAPLYAPTFDNVYTTTLKNTCGSEVNACHSAAGRQGNVSFESEPIAYAALIDGHVTPGDPGCSQMVVITSSVGARFQMPPGDPLSAAERCALIHWVQAGAPGPGALP
jgi:hypothetical protein